MVFVPEVGGIFDFTFSVFLSVSVSMIVFACACVCVCVCISDSKLLRYHWADSLQTWWIDESNTSEDPYLYLNTVSPSVCVSVCLCVRKLLQGRWGDFSHIRGKDAPEGRPCSYLFFMTLRSRSRSPEG